MRLPNLEQANAALEGNFWGLWRRFGQGENCRLYEESAATWFATPITSLPYNTVIRFQAPVDRLAATVDRIMESHKARPVPLTWAVHPTSTPGLATELEQRGFGLAETLPCMWADLSDLPALGDPAPGITIAEVQPGGEVESVLGLVSWRWHVAPEDQAHLRGFLSAFRVGEPGSALRCWAAWRDGVPLAKALLNLDDGAAGIYGVATRPEARGLGLARQVTLLALHAARQAGYRLGVLHTSRMARSLYEKIGFRDAGSEFRVYAPAGDFDI